MAQSADRRYAYSRRYAVVVPAGAVVQAPAKGGGWRRVFGAAGIESAAVKAHRNLDFDGIGNRLVPAAKARAVLGLPEPVHPLPHLPRQAACLGGVSVCIPRAAGAAHAVCSNPALCVHSEVVGRACGRTLCSLMRIDGKNKWKNIKFQLTFGNTLNIIKIR